MWCVCICARALPFVGVALQVGEVLLEINVHCFDMKCALDMHVYSLVCVLYWFMCVFMCVDILVRNHVVMCTRLSGFHVSRMLLFLYLWLFVI